MKKILLIATGGTIASEYTDEGLTPQLSSEELLRYIPSASELCEIHTCEPFSVDSTNINAEHWIRLAALIEEKYKYYDGFVICHGTDTMAYTASALSYLVQNNRKPIVITGAQKPINLDVSDARLNLLDSIRFAAHPKSCGTVIVFGGKVIAGTRAKKVFSKSYNAFLSINYPEIAVIHDNRIIFYIDEKDRINEPVRFYHKMNDRVLLLKLIPSLKAEALYGLADSYDGLIVESFGVGGLPDYGGHEFEKLIGEWAKAGKMIVMSTQVTHEGSDMCVYRVGKQIKEKFPVLETYDMTLEAAVTKMMWILAGAERYEEYEELFYRRINHDILMYRSTIDMSSQFILNTWLE